MQTTFDPSSTAALKDIADSLRCEVIRMTTAAGSGHPSSCLSCAEIVAALFFRQMRWDPGDPQARNVDGFVLSKGHAAPILWAVLAKTGAIAEDPLSLRKLDSSLEGHPTRSNPWIRVATGSLGQGLAAANGMALANRLDRIDARIYCLMGDGECSEGAVWEAAQFASLNRLAKVTAIVDLNGLGQSGPTPYGHDSSVLAGRFAAFGWRSLEIDGHDPAAVLAALASAEQDGPTAIIARTVKGKGVSFIENADGWHGKPLSAEQMEKALAEIGEPAADFKVEPRRIGNFSKPPPTASGEIEVGYELGAKVATREAYGPALKKLGAQNSELVVLDGDTKGSTYAKVFEQAFPARFFEAYIAEQNLVSTALGLASCGKLPFASTFACFFSRAYDQIRMASYSRPPHLVFCGSHAGVSIGEDGPSQMGLEDLAMFRALAQSTVLYPSDAVSMERLAEQAIRTAGLVYLRSTRPKTPVLYAANEAFPVGGSKVLRSSAQDRYSVVAAGITLHEALAAWDILNRQGIAVRVIDAYSVKPIDAATLLKAASETRAIVVVEDHWPAGGLGEAVAQALGGAAPLHCLAVTGEPHSGTMEELLERHGISRQAIVARVLELEGRSRRQS